MKPFVLFLAGALLSGIVVYYVTAGRSKEPVAVTEKAPVPAEQPLQATPAVEQPPPAAETPTPEPAKPSAFAAPAKKAAAPPASHRREPVAPKHTPAAAPQQTASSAPPQQPSAPAPYVPESSIRPSDPAPAAEVKKPEPPPPPQPKTVTIPAGTLLTVRIDQALSSSTNQTGDTFRASLDQPLVIDGFVIAERGARIEGRVSEVDPGGRVRGVASMNIELVRLTTADGQRVRLQTESFNKQAERTRSKDAAKIGAAAGIGAAIGAIAGGGRGAAIGAAAGGAAGAGGVMATRGGAAQLPAETRLSFRLRDPITITEKLN